MKNTIRDILPIIKEARKKLAKEDYLSIKSNPSQISNLIVEKKRISDLRNGKGYLKTLLAEAMEKTRFNRLDSAQVLAIACNLLKKQPLSLIEYISIDPEYYDSFGYLLDIQFGDYDTVTLIVGNRKVKEVYLKDITEEDIIAHLEYQAYAKNREFRLSKLKEGYEDA